MDRPDWDVIVIGSGIGGLVTASQLAAKGARVLVLERYLIPGGSGGSFRRQGFTFDVGASMIFGFGEKGHTNLLTRALADVGERCATVPDPAQLAYHLPDGLEVAVDRNYDTFLADLTALFPHEARGIRAFYDTCWQVFRCLDAMPLLSLEDPAYLAKVFFRAPLACLGLARWLPVNVGDVARRHIQDQALLKFIDMECFCWSVMPADRTPMINAGMVFSDRHAGGINYPRGGVGMIAEKLVAGLERHGGAIRYKARVTEVLLEGDRPNARAVGVKLASGETIQALRVVSNATRWDTFAGAPDAEGSVNQPLVDAAHTPAAEATWRRRYRPSASFLSLHLGVEASLIPAGLHCHHLLLEDWSQMEEEQGVIFVSIPTLLDPSLAPEGRHIVHTFTPSAIEHWRQLSPAAYRAKKEADAARLVQRLEAILPGLAGAIRLQEIGTPRTHRRFLGRMGGSYGPIPALPLPGLLPMPFNRTGIGGLYCVGDSCFPGQGLNAVAFSGFACAHRIGADLGLNPWALPA
ncbi:carotenoid isomerase [Synechococcus sp. CCY9201]|uniref:carotenoid isomerase n=1 Tax=unclassified Synechococcus TaxID=2626047 RepID=UPI002AD5231B|nr:MULTISPECIES: carotenoid isomerase [unclassified Synechococcus]MEA5424007.1 carotenoid isomerase [Synechococcus sp. CCY9202]MEA5474859.1 carotenoid isomerase [Synechococcus sp. CCY9201]CAK6698712.1 4,4'-diapolycopene oxygenase [Synechococcus sp. CBW1107]